MVTRNSLKEYYVNLLKLYNNAANMLTAINQSLTTNANEVTVTFADTDDVTHTLRLPSFLYLENRVEELGNTISNIFNIPDSGEAWFQNTGNMFKLNLVRPNIAPITPILDLSKELNAYATENNILKDLVNPKTYIRINVSNLPNNINEMFMRKLVFLNPELYELVNASNTTSYDDIHAILDLNDMTGTGGYKKGVDYLEYDSVLKMPIKNDKFKSRFEILNIPVEDGVPNPKMHYTDENGQQLKQGRLQYTVQLDTINYYNPEDSSVSFSLNIGDELCLGNNMCVYTIKDIVPSTGMVILEEKVGHMALQTTEENDQMVFTLYNSNYDNFHYVDIPLEENPYICVFIGTIYNNIRSILTDGLLLNLNTIYMCDASGNYMLDEGQKISYISYYKKYCKNIGDLIQGLTDTIYPQISNYTYEQLQLMLGINAEGTLQTYKESIMGVLGAAIDYETELQVVPINKHLIADEIIETIENLHKQKNDLNAQLETVANNISNVYNQLKSTDFTQEVNVTQEQLQSQLTSYYTERTDLRKQLNTVIANIQQANADQTIALSDTKYRIRGILKYENFEKYIQGMLQDPNCNVIAADIEYCYKSTTRDVKQATVIATETFSPWNKQPYIERERHLDINENGAIRVVYDNYSTVENPIKWNRIDIPIQNGEDVVIRFRFKYNVGQPFINLYTPWSDEMEVSFPAYFKEETTIRQIIENNTKDEIVADFTGLLINDGYQEHINNTVISNAQTFYHQPENIYSGFNTAENNLLSLKDKLTLMDRDLNDYKIAVDQEANSKYAVELKYDETTIELEPMIENTVNIYTGVEHTDTITKKKMNIVIKNTGDVPLRLYSIFPGATDVSLLSTDIRWYNDIIMDYERVPIFVRDELKQQTLGQCIYFRSTNPYTSQLMYYDTKGQQKADALNKNANKQLTFNSSPIIYMSLDNSQPLLGFRDRQHIYDNPPEVLVWQSLASYASENIENQIPTECGCPDDCECKQPMNLYNSSIETRVKSNYLYNNYNSFLSEPTKSDDSNNYDIYNRYIHRYEDIWGVNADVKGQKHITVDENMSLSKLVNNGNISSTYVFTNFSGNVASFTGAFLYPHFQAIKTILTNGTEKGYVEVPVGKSLSIPVEFEMFLPTVQNSNTENEINSITRTLMFDIRESLIRDVDHFILKVVGNKNAEASNLPHSELENLRQLEDEITYNN